MTRHIYMPSNLVKKKKTVAWMKLFALDVRANFFYDLKGGKLQNISTTQ